MEDQTRRREPDDVLPPRGTAADVARARVPAPGVPRPGEVTDQQLEEVSGGIGVTIGPDGMPIYEGNG